MWQNILIRLRLLNFDFYLQTAWHRIKNNCQAVKKHFFTSCGRYWNILIICGTTKAISHQYTTVKHLLPMNVFDFFVPKSLVLHPSRAIWQNCQPVFYQIPLTVSKLKGPNKERGSIPSYPYVHHTTAYRHIFRSAVSWGIN